MAGSIERVLSPEEQELQRYLGEIDQLKSQVATQLADLETYKAELARFSAEYHAVLGPLFAELDRLELEIEEYRLRIRLLEATPELNTSEVEEEVERQFHSKRERLEEEEAQNEAYENAWRQEEAKPDLDEGDAVELKRTYRDLAKKHHPDFAVDDKDRAERETSMQKINAAFANRDLSSLRSMKESLKDHLATFEKLSIGEKLVWAIREVSRLEHRLSVVQRDISDLHATSISNLVSLDHSQPGVIVRSTSELRVRIRQHKEVLDNLEEQYNWMVMNRQGIS